MTLNKKRTTLQAVKAAAIVAKALREGRLWRPNICELCDNASGFSTKTHIVTHHWNGYDKPLDVWWLCYQCSGKLKGERFHSGIVTKEEARQIIQDILSTRLPVP